MWSGQRLGKRILASPIASYALFLSGFAAYIAIASGRRLDAEWTQAFTEAPLLLYLFALLQAPLRRNRLRPWVAAWPLAWLYLLHDEYFLRWGDVPSFADVALFADLFVVIGIGWGALVVLALLLPLFVWFACLERPPPYPRRVTLLLLAAAVLGWLSLVVAPARTYAVMNGLTEDAEWSDRRNAEQWGRVYAALLRQARRGSFAEELRDFQPLVSSPLHVSREELASLDRRNVHIIVMESFVDLRLLTGVQFSKPPFDPELARWVDPYLGTSISPVFGGETARAEFEVLCGVPSLRLFGLEFLGFSGARTYCLPTILGEAGYRTVLTFPHGPVFFNTRRAYPGLGFDQVIYADRFSSPGSESVAIGDVDYIEDGDLFPQNLHKVRALLRQGRPFLNYVMTLYGHWPFDIDTRRHPSEISVTPPSEDLRKMANQMLLRTRALHAYLKALIDLDPTGIIVLVGDHLPPLPGGKAEYLRLGYRERPGFTPLPSEFRAYENFLLVLVAGVPQKLPRMRHFDLSRWVLNELSHGETCRRRTCDFGRTPFDRQEYLGPYQTILGLAAGP